jgi:hypothetical protein
MGYSTDIKLDLMVTGSNSGTWGTKTNTNLQLIEEALCGYIDQTIAGSAGTTALTIADASSSNGRNMVIKLSGTITGNRIVTVPTALEKIWIFSNETSGVFTVQLKGASDSGSGYTFSTTNKGKRLLYMTGTDMVDSGFSSSAIDALVDDTTPQLGGDLDVNGNDIVSVSAGNIDIVPNGAGVVRAKDVGGTTAAVKIAGKETMWVPATAMYPTTSNGAEAAQAELTATQPELKTLAFDTTTAEYAQFNVCFPKSWDESDVTFQTYWSASATDTGTGGFKLQGISIANDIDYDTAFGTAVANTAIAASGAQDDLMVNVESGAVTIASAAVDTNTVFQIVRNVAVDTNTGDLRLLGVKIFYTTNASNDS